MSLLTKLFGNKSDASGVSTEAEGILGVVSKIFDKNEKEVAKLRPIVEQVGQIGAELQPLSDEEIKARSLALKARFKDEVLSRLGKAELEWLELETQFGWTNDYIKTRLAIEKEVLNVLLPEAFALCREAGDRTIGLRHFDVQLIGGAVLHGGKIAEMRTGEGKTLVATLPAYLNALSGRGVHCVTVNDYLAERDANWMRPVYEFLGLSVAFLQNDMDSSERQIAYACDILYGTNSEFGFDYLRDNMARSPEDLSQRPLNFAIIDEVDNILIDEARTPLIISAQVAKTDRALRRQTMSKTCDAVATVLSPAVTDRDVEAFIEGFSSKNKVDIAALSEAILARGAFKEATNYLISAYLQSETSARNTNAARLLDAAQELFEDKLIGETGRAQLERLALDATKPALLHERWREEIQGLVQSFEFAVLNAKDADFNAELLAHDLGLGADAAAELEIALEEHDDKLAWTLDFVAGEMARRGLIEDEAKASVASALDNSHDALVDAVLRGPGNLSDADKILRDKVPTGDAVDVAAVRGIVAALETLTQNSMLPFDSLENLWQSVEIPLKREQLRAELLKTINSDAGNATSEIKKLTSDYSTKRTQFLGEQAQILGASLSATPAVAKLAERGESAANISAALQRELSKSGAFSQAIKAAQTLQKEQEKAYSQIAGALSDEMATFLEEMPPDAKKILVSLLAAGGKQNEVSERLVGAVRDLPGDSQELSSLAADAATQLQTWRQENSVAFVQKIDALVALPDESKVSIQNAIEDGQFPETGLDEFVGAQLLNSPTIAPQSQAVETYGARWDEFKAQSNAQLLENIAAQLELGQDAREALGDLLARPDAGALDAQILETLAADTVARHLEPLLTEENARAFTDETKRRILVDKDIEKNVKIKPADFVGRSADQLSRALSRLVPRSLEVLEFDKYKRVVKNLGWFAEKDEKRRTAALTDMGTLVADREAAREVFADPENFLETLLQGDILTEDEILVVQNGAEDGELVSQTVDRLLRLPADRRRRLAEAKLQEVQSVLDQSIKAHALFEYNVNYVIGREESGKQGIVIVDEFTGRTMPGRRFSEGLHEALEAKHGLDVQIESQTVATVTIQNYFRLYNKLAGLTGTAKTEETEFAKTYQMEVVSVPTNKPVRRKDAPDVVYKTAEAKFRAITFDILEHHVAGQPVLTGTRSVEISEQMGRRLSANSLQNLVLCHLIKEKIIPDKTLPDADKQGMLAFVRQPLLQLNPVQVKALAKNVGLNPDPTADENLDALLAVFNEGTPDRNLLSAALKQGLPHNVLNAKNHRNEARIIAEAARPGAVTIATNMAGRGVDIILGGSLDGESRWRVISQQLLARAVEGKSVHVRSRNAEATQKMVARLNPDALQTLAWAVANQKAVEELERQKQLEGQAAKELKDALGTDLTSPDFANRVRSRARRFNLLEKLPVEVAPLEAPIVEALTADLGRLMGREYDAQAVAQFLQSGLAAQEHASQTANLGRSGEELALLFSLAQPLAFSQNATETLLDTLAEIQSLDAQLLELVAAGGNLQPDALAANLNGVTSEWVVARLNELGVPNSAAAKERLAELDSSVKEVSELQIALLLGENFPGTPWLRARLSEWQAVDNARPFEATPEMQQILQDGANVHLSLQTKVIAKKRAEWSLPHRRREMVGFELPNLIILQELAQVVGAQAPFLEPQWLHETISQLGLSGENDVFQANMMAQVQDENGVEAVQQIEVLVYHYTLGRMLEAIKPTVRAAAKDVGEEPEAIFQALSQVAPWLQHFADADWLKKTLAEAPQEESEATTQQPDNQTTPVVIETGVSGQSADVVLEAEARPEDIAHTSDRDEVTGCGGLHIIGTERHESRRIDNQLRGRAGRQGDPGTSRFYISLDDELWRLFGTRANALLNGWDEEEAVENKIITKSIERAQKKVELNHFESRKQVLQYDDVMNMQREVIYRERRRALAGEDIRDTVSDMAHKAALAEAEKHCPRNVRPDEWDEHKLYLGLGRLFGSMNLRHHVKETDLEGGRWLEKPTSDIANPDFDFVLASGETFGELTEKLYQEREEALGTDQTRGLERWQVMKSIDSHWMEHLAEMDYLRDAIWQQGYAQKEPIGVYRQEGFSLFQKMLVEIRREVTESIFSYDVPDFENQSPTLEIGELEEGRMVEMGFGDDGVDDGTQLEKDADGEEEVAVQVRPQQNVPNAPNNRAARRKNKRGN